MCSKKMVNCVDLSITASVDDESLIKKKTSNELDVVYFFLTFFFSMYGDW